MKKRRLLVSALACGLLVLSACSSSSKSSSGSSSTAAGTSGASVAANTDPITIYVTGQIAAPTFAYPEIPTIAQAHADVVNAAGGINGHQIKVVSCNDQGVQTGATSCAREAAASSAVAVLQGYTRYGDAVLPLYEQAKLVMVGNQATTVQDFTNAYSFPAGVPQANLGGVVKKMLAQGCKNLTFIHWDTPTSVIAKPLIQKIVTDAGGKFFDANENTGAADYGPVAAAISQQGSTCAYSFLPGTDGIKWAIAQKQRDPNFILGGAFQQAQLKSLGSAGEGIVIGTSYPDPTQTDIPEVKDFHTELTAKGIPDASQSPTGMSTWAAFKLLLGAIGTIQGKVDRDAVFKAMNNITKPATTLFGNYNTTKPNSQKDYARAFNTQVYLFTTKAGQVIPDGAPTDVRDIFN